MNPPKTTAAYAPPSTHKQEVQHQWDLIQKYIEEEGLDEDQVIKFVDIESGANDDRDQFNELFDKIENNEITDVVVWEISRISRRGATLQQFFDSCADNEVTIHITDGAVEKIKPDGTGRFVADIIGMVYQQERRLLKRRSTAGVERAKKEGKWVGNVPAGFKRDENGFLQPILEPEEGEDSYFEIVNALERVEDGESYRSVAKTISLSRQGLMKIYKDDTRKGWYLEEEANDDRVAEAIRSL